MAVGVWTFSQLELASAAPIGVRLSVAGQRGQHVFKLHCAACHNTNNRMKVGPGLAGLFESGGPALPGGVDYGGKLPHGEDITPENVATWLRQGGRGRIGIMPPVGMAMSDSETADLIEFLAFLRR
jgi:cytochrome c